MILSRTKAFCIWKLLDTLIILDLDKVGKFYLTEVRCSKQGEQKIDLKRCDFENECQI